MAWLYLFIAGFFEVLWAVAVKYCDGFKINVPLIIVVISMIFSIIFLKLAINQIPMSIAYAVWTGIGILGVSLYGIFALKETASILTIIFIGCILFGIIGLKLQSK